MESAQQNSNSPARNDENEVNGLIGKRLLRHRLLRYNRDQSH